MRIYVETNLRLSDVVKRNLKQKFEQGLKMFYGRFTLDDEFCYYTESKTANVYISGETIYLGVDKDVEELVKKIFEHFTGYQDVNVMLDCSDTSCKMRTDFPEVKIQEDKSMNNNVNTNSEFDYEKLAENYHAEEPRYSFDQVVLTDSLNERIQDAIAIIEAETKVFDEWGLRNIIPHASSALNFFGAPGTGKSMTAEAIAHSLGKKILKATYADIESKYHGEGPKMVKAIFKAAELEDAVLFIDESDSLLSKRMTNISEGSSQAINSMRSQLLVCLEQFKGIVIFATNLMVNYDKAFLSRLINIEFQAPDADGRLKIWNNHMFGDGVKIPFGDDIDLKDIAEKYEFCGRDIKNAVKDVCVSVVRQQKDRVFQSDIIKTCERIKSDNEAVLKAQDHTKSENEAVLKAQDHTDTFRRALKEAGTKKSIDEMTEETEQTEQAE